MGHGGVRSDAIGTCCCGGDGRESVIRWGKV